MNRRNSFALSAAAFAVCALLHLFIGKQWTVPCNFDEDYS